jgi:3-hydroxyacyl-[acyl-carrier-protein] dehydratase
LDRVLSLARNSRITAIKNVALSEDVFADHFLGKPVMPGCLQIEALAQAGTVLLEASSGLTTKALLIMINSAKFREMVRPGDQLILDAELISRDLSSSVIRGQIRVADQVVTNAVLTFTEKPAAEIYHPRLHVYVVMLYAHLLEGARLEDITLPDEAR